MQVRLPGATARRRTPARPGTCWPSRRRSPADRPALPGCRAGRAWWRPWRPPPPPPPVALGGPARFPAPPAPPASAGRRSRAAGAPRPRCWHGRDARRRRRRSRKDRPAQQAPRRSPDRSSPPPAWKRVFSSTSTSPGAIRATACCATGPMQSRAKPHDVRPAPSPSARATGASDISGTRLPFGRSKWLHTITFAPLPTSSRIVGVSRSIRVRSEIMPVVHRHVEVGAQQHALARDVHPVERAERHARLAPTGCRTAPRCRPCGWRSPTRCRTSPSPAPARHRPPRSAVASKLHDAGQWLKSMLTSGAVL